MSSFVSYRSGFSALWAAFFIITSFHALGQTPNVDHELVLVKSHFDTAGPVALGKTQATLLLLGAYAGSIDGSWSPETARAIQGMMETYIAIGGRGPDWGVNGPADVGRFLDWLDAAAESNLTGSEFPD